MLYLCTQKQVNDLFLLGCFGTQHTQHASCDLVEPEIVEAADKDHPNGDNIEVRAREVIDVPDRPCHPPVLYHDGGGEYYTEDEEADEHRYAVDGEPDGVLHVTSGEEPVLIHKRSCRLHQG